VKAGECSRVWKRKHGKRRTLWGLVLNAIEGRKEVRDGLNEDGVMIDIVIMIMIMVVTYLVFEKDGFPLVHSLTEA
jgi:hypothetical protein